MPSSTSLIPTACPAKTMLLEINVFAMQTDTSAVGNVNGVVKRQKFLFEYAGAFTLVNVRGYSKGLDQRSERKCKGGRVAVVVGKRKTTLDPCVFANRF